MFSLAQYDAAHRSAVLVEVPTRGTIALAGADRRSFLHALVTNDVATLTDGKGTYAAYLTPQGRMISDMRIVDIGDRLLVGVERHVTADLAQRLDKLIFSEDVQVDDLSGRLDEVGIHGPQASAIIERVIGVSVDLTNQYDNVTIHHHVVGQVTIVRDDAFGIPGIDMYVSHEGGGVLRERLIGAGATMAGVETLETLRIEAGRPRFGVDMNTETIPLEAAIEDRAISFTKGCYVGQEVIIRVMYRGHGRVVRRLVRLTLQGEGVPSPADKVFSGNREVGQITSAAASPKARAPMAMAYIHRDFTAAGTELLVNGSKAIVYQPGN